MQMLFRLGTGIVQHVAPGRRGEKATLMHFEDAKDVYRIRRGVNLPLFIYILMSATRAAKTAKFFNIIYKYVFGAVGCFPGPYLAKRFYRSTHKLKKYC